jgi:hypothetical protein
MHCLPSQAGNPFLSIDVPAGAVGYAEQLVALPVGGALLSLRTWGHFDPSSAIISLIDGLGRQYILDSFTVPSLEGPDDYRRCSGRTPVTKSYNLALFAGRTVRLRLEATATGFNGTITDFDDVTLTELTQVYWKGGAGNWSDPANWTPFPPTAQTVTTLPAGSAVTVDVPTAEINALILDAGSTVTVQSGAALALAGPGLNNGTFAIERGGEVGMCGVGSGGFGFIQNGTLNISPGGQMVAMGGWGSGGFGVQQTGGASTVGGTLDLGGGPVEVLDGTLNIPVGGQVAACGIGTGGFGYSQTGGSTIVNGTMDIAAGSVGSGGFGLNLNGGTFQVGNGGQVAMGSIGSGGFGFQVQDGDFIVDPGGTISIGCTVAAGCIGSGGFGFNQTGGSTIVNGTMDIAAGGIGSGGFGLNLNGGTFQVGNGGQVAMGGIGSGGFGFQVQDGNLTIDSGGTIAGGSLGSGGFGFNQTGGSTLVNGTINVAMGSVGTGGFGLNLNGGTLGGSGIIDGGLIAEGGYLSPGASPGTLTIKSNFTQKAGNTLVIQVAGRDSGQCDQLRVGGAVELGGNLQVELLDSFAPDLGERFSFLSSTNLSGAFKSVTAPMGISMDNSITGPVPVVTGIVPTQILGPVLAGGNAVFTFGTVSNRGYTVEWAAEVTATGWSTYTNLLGTGTRMQVTAPLTSATRRFFRVRQP